MIYAAICDDNNIMLDYLVKIVSENFDERRVEYKIKPFHSSLDFLAFHEKQPFDVVFLDIIMPEINGFEAAKQIRRIASNTYIIFITTESSLVYDSFDFQPFYFIPKEKPQVLEKRLKYVIEKLTLNLAANEKVHIFGSGETERYISPNDILYIKSSSNQITINLTVGKAISIRQKLTDFLETLNQYIFARSHNRIVVNMKHIERVDYSNMEILLDNGEVLVMSRGYKESFKAAYIRYTRNFS